MYCAQAHSYSLCEKSVTNDPNVKKNNPPKYIVVNWDEHDIEKMGLVSINESMNGQTKREKSDFAAAAVDDDEDNEIIFLHE